MAAKKSTTKRKTTRRKTMSASEMQDRRDTSHSLGYLIAKMEALDSFIRDHMNKEEKTTDDLYKRLDQQAHRLGQLRTTQIILLVAIVIISTGTPLGEIIMKLLGHM